MARGWESKSVESQQEDRERQSTVVTPISAEDAARATRRRTLELSRARVVADLAHARSPQHRAMLEAAIRALDADLARESLSQS